MVPKVEQGIAAHRVNIALSVRVTTHLTASHRADHTKEHRVAPTGLHSTTPTKHINQPTSSTSQPLPTLHMLPSNSIDISSTAYDQLTPLTWSPVVLHAELEVMMPKSP